MTRSELFGKKNFAAREAIPDCWRVKRASYHWTNCASLWRWTWRSPDENRLLSLHDSLIKKNRRLGLRITQRRRMGTHVCTQWPIWRITQRWMSHTYSDQYDVSHSVGGWEHMYAHSDQYDVSHNVGCLTHTVTNDVSHSVGRCHTKWPMMPNI